MWKSTIARRRAVAISILAVSLAGCGGTATPSSSLAPSQAAPQSTASSAPTPTAAPPTEARTPRPSPSPSASRRPPATPSPTFESAFYRYRITLPAGIQTLNWKAAVRPWDGRSMLDRAGPFTDQTGIAEGGLFLFGAEDESLQTWFERVEGNGIRYHRCSAAQNRVDVTINDVPAIGFSQVCDQNTNMARVALWKDGWGIGVWLGEAPVSELPARRDRAIELLDGLEWLTD